MSEQIETKMDALLGILQAAIREAGCPVTLEQELQSPNWRAPLEEWAAHVPDEVQAAWPHLSESGRTAVYLCCKMQADRCYGEAHIDD